VGQLIIIVALFVLLWLLLIRPQRKRQLEQQQLHASLEVGDEVLTVGGLYGHVREMIDEDDLLVEVAPGVNVRIARRSVAGIVEEEDDEPQPSEQQRGELEEADPEAGTDADSQPARQSPRSGE
jgi:preprotein translocase subunit YajC